MNGTTDIDLLIRSKVPLIVVESAEERRVVTLITNTGLRGFRPVYLWTCTDGLRRVDATGPGLPDTQEPQQVLERIKRTNETAIYILADFHPYLGEPVHIRLLKDIALDHDLRGDTVVLVSHALTLPPELRRSAATIELALPGKARIEVIVREVAKEWNQSHSQPVKTDEETFRLLVDNLAGLTEPEVRRVARLAIFDDGAITPSDLNQVMRAKYQLLNHEGVLTFEYETAKFAEVGGLRHLKAWLEQRGGFFRGAGAERAIDPPKGVLLLGVQGSGKSLAAKAVAGTWGVPLLRLDFATLYNKFHGETERNLREALKAAEAMAPCVLWADEIEKGLATGGEDGGTSRRVLGTLLTWLSERDAPVFMVATANQIDELPAELIRKGRFDEIFFIDLPQAPVREEIFAIHLEKRRLDPTAFQLAQLAERSEGFSGAEIEQVVVASLYTCHALDRDPKTVDLLEEIARTRPLSVVMREQVEMLREWAQERTVPAD